MINFGDFLLFLLGSAIAIFLAWIAFCILHWLFRVIVYSFHYGPVKTSKGKVTNMDYTPARTTYNGVTAVRSSEKNIVYFTTDQGSTEVDSDLLYQRVRIGESIKVTYQNRYKQSRWDGRVSPDGMRLLSIQSRLKQVVNFNDPKPVRPGLE